MLLLRVGAFLCLAGWTWVHFYWEGPYGVLLWQESSHALAERMGIDWDEFVGTGANDGLVQRWIGFTSWFYLAATILTVTARKKSYLQMMGLQGAGALLGILAYARFIGAQCQIPMLVEHETATSLLWWAGILDFLVCVGIFLKVSRRSCALYAAIWGLLTAIARPVAGMSLSLNYWGADQFIHEAVLRAQHYVIPLYLFLVWRRSDELETIAGDSKTETGPDGCQTAGPGKITRSPIG